MRFSKGWTLVLCLLVAAVFVATTFAQETTGGLQGTVKDSQGAVVAKAAVEVTSPALIGSKKLETDAGGYYRFANLPPGVYTLMITAQGFRAYKQTGITLEVGGLPTIDVALQVGTQEQVVEVTGEAPLIDVTVTKTQTNVPEAVLNYAPQGRSFQSVMAFAPAARQEPLQGGGFSVAGAAQTENQYLIEGQDTGDVINGASVANTPFEFIQEVTVKSSGIEAEHAGALGGVVNVVQKRGGNTWHGAFWLYYEPNSVDAAPSHYWRYDPQGATTSANRGDIAAQFYQPKKDKFLYATPGVSIGGPIMKDRLWIFLAFAPQYFKSDRTVDMNVTKTTIFTPDNIQGPTKFTRHDETYYGTARVDYLITNKIRVFGSWLYQYGRQNGINRPNADDVGGLYNVTATLPIAQYSPTMSTLTPDQLYNIGADITVTPNIIATTRYGYSFQNLRYRGYPNSPIYYWNASGTSAKQWDGTTAVGGILGSVASGSSNYPNTRLNNRNANKKNQLTGDLAWFKKAYGTHNFKFGYQMNRLQNDDDERYFDSYVRLFPGRAYTTLSSQGAANCAALVADPLNTAGGCRGTYGYTVIREYAVLSNLTSFNHGIYAQDAWTIGKGLTLNVGFRMDKEYLPADPRLGLPNNRGVDFTWADKFAPRIGVAWDPMQNGKMKIFGSFGVFYDQMKLGLARGSFGGDFWHDCVYALNTNDPTTVVPLRTGSGNHYCEGDGNTPASLAVANPNIVFIENIDYRKEASAGEAVDKGLKPYRQHESVLGVDYQLSKNWAFEARWDRRRLDRAIEDAGIIEGGSETFTIVNPGFGSNAKLLEPCPGCPTNGVLPKAIRDYDGVEFRVTKAMAQHWFGQFSYTWSRLWGNYSGLTSSDVSDGGTGGRLDPNNNRAFDEAYFMYDAYGHYSNGLLATDRPHAFKAYGYYSLPWASRLISNFGVQQQLFSGTPLTSYLDVAYNAGSAPVYVEGRAKWVDITTDATGAWTIGSSQLRRTPAWAQTDFRFSQQFKVKKDSESQLVSFDVDVTNLFNRRAVTAITSQINSLNNTRYLHVGDCNLPSADQLTCNMNPVLLAGYDWKAMVNGYLGDGTPYAGNALYLSNRYGKPMSYQDGRTFRLALRYTW